MRRLGKLFKIIGTIGSDPKQLLKVLNPEADAKKRIAKAHPGFSKGLPDCRITDVFPNFSETVSPYSFLDGTSSLLDLALLKMLARKKANCRFLEIGTWRGESVANVAEIAADNVTINLSDAELSAIGKNKEYAEQIGFFSHSLPNIRHIRGNSLDMDLSSLGRFDLVFVDGDHHYESVKKDTANAFGCLAGEDSVIVWHDYVFPSGSIRQEVLAGILDGAPPGTRKWLRGLFPSWCAVYCKAFEKAPVYPHRILPVPEDSFEITIRARSL